ncbi:hypothetical protein [Piscirickettsia litoralis]|uniref:Uncharacterized protein n=1 Tax=Piscirickettsia litoralis TaxID=1891921 RepID=A0ABX3A1L5_9GAMM|nr:hypothetical protein [Piscirickettsia litoralis]ODN41556.1 hypothetical protein BGC07_15725 [Piscirickettsia litoralis]
MALDSGQLKSMIIANLQAYGFVTEGPHARAHVMAEAVAKAVVEHIQNNAEVPVTGGSSAGNYSVK